MFIKYSYISSIDYSSIIYSSLSNLNVCIYDCQSMFVKDKYLVILIYLITVKINFLELKQDALCISGNSINASIISNANFYML